MFRSIRFWAIAIGVGLVLWLGRDQISTSLDKLPLQATPRTTDTKALASATPSTIAKTPTVTSSSATRTAAPTTQTVTPSTTMTTSLSAQSSATTVKRATSYGVYVVKKGDTLYSIAKRYRISVAELQRINGISDPSKLAVGQELKVPQASSAPASKPALVTPLPGTKRYKVQPGDTLSSIARKFQTSVAELQKLNNFSNPNQLVVGALILVPATSSSSGGTDSKSGTTTGNQEVRIMPVGTTTAASPSTVVPSPTPTPIPTMPSICEGNQEAVFVWGVSFCIPPGWALQEYVQPYRTALLTRDEASGDRSIYAISRLDGSPNAPLSWSMRQAKKAVATEIASLIPGGLAQPETWTLATGFDIANVKGQMSETETTYLKTGNRARVRVIVFNAAGQRWRIIMVVPEQLWQGYNVTVFPYIARTLDIF